ncbi:MAG: hypothetical protein OEU56_06980, partial [Rhodospirillales bacterium]|nr:hypothetical protein [Rhodospirillales bacterium]
EIGLSVTAVAAWGFKAELHFSFDTETFEVGSEATLGLRYGFEIGIGVPVDISESGTEAENDVSTSDSWNVGGGIGPFGGQFEFFGSETDDGVTVYKGPGEIDFDIDLSDLIEALGEIDTKIQMRAGASIGFDKTISGTTSVLSDGIDALSETMVEAEEMVRGGAEEEHFDSERFDR